jgi:HlyD family secretion protein
MIGTVIEVSSFPSTPQGMMRILRNESLVQQMSATGSPIQVLIEPELDPSTRSGFKWSSRMGPDQEVVAGTLAYASVVVENRKPIHLVLPLLKRWFLGIENAARK